MSDMFALVIAGRPLFSDFEQIDQKKLVANVPEPQSIREFTICLLKPEIPEGMGCAVYYSLPPFEDWQYLGPVSLTNPTVTFRAPWQQGDIGDYVQGVQIGVALESLQHLSTLQISDQKEDERTLDSAKGIAQDLFNFMSSFAQQTGQFAELGDVLVIPTNCVDLWYKKFLNKHRRTPYFWQRKNA